MAKLSPASGVMAVLASAALATPLIAKYEGLRNVGYKDPAPGAYDTICYGHKQSGVAGKKASDAECGRLLAMDAVSHGMDVAGCIPPDTPVSVRAAFTSFAFNVGAPTFCKSTMGVKARARDWIGACKEFPKWTYSGSVQLPGLVGRRAAEQELCEQDLK